MANFASYENTFELLTIIGERLSNKPIVSNTTAGWNSQPSLISEKDRIYVYTDYQMVDDQPVPGLKVGDGNAYLIDIPFISFGDVTPEERAIWNNKVSAAMSTEDAENLIFSTS